MNEKKYISPFSSRYASSEMEYLFSQEFKTLTFRRLWVSLAKAQRKLGLPIEEKQIKQMELHLEEIDPLVIETYEKRFRHDVMAHLHAFGDRCPLAKPIIHLGATSCYVTDNTDLIQFKKGLHLLLRKLIHVLKLLADLAAKEANTPCLGYTHYQSAQPTTMGKRICLWLQDFFIDAQDWNRILDAVPFLGAKGATGTQGSFLALFDMDSSKVIELEKLIADDFEFTQILPISGQTYTRKIDITILNAFASFAASSHKMGTDIRLLSHDGELFESFKKTQIGSSAMPYKRNPIYSERICGLSRFVISLAQNGTYTAATQWLERSLDDSSNRRIVIPEAFLGVDSLLNLLSHLVSNLNSSPSVSLERLNKELPSLIMENVLMEAVKNGGDRQLLHEKLRQFSKQSLSDFLKEILNDPDFHLTQQQINPLLSTASLIGRAPEQVSNFLEKNIFPLIKKWEGHPVNLPSIEI